MQLEKLRMLVYEKYGNVRKFSQATGVYQSYMSLIISGKKKPGWDMMAKLIKLLNIPGEDVGFLFFPDSIADCETENEEEE